MSGRRVQFSSRAGGDGGTPAMEGSAPDALGGGPIGGGLGGKLGPGVYEGELLVVERREDQVSWVIQTPAGLCHHEVSRWLPPELQIGTRCKATITPTQGYYWRREGGRVTPVDADTHAPLPGFGWYEDMGAGYRDLATAGHRPCSTKVSEVLYGDNQRYAPAQA